MRTLLCRIRVLLASEHGSATIEYALVTVAAAALAGVLFLVVSGADVAGDIERLIDRALSVQ
jgi:Flp pilus assembly pilin Flp